MPQHQPANGLPSNIAQLDYRLMAKGMPNIMFGSVHRFPRDQVVGSLENQSVNKLNSREKPLAET